jgi:hypothetical protein
MSIVSLYEKDFPYIAQTNLNGIIDVENTTQINVRDTWNMSITRDDLDVYKNSVINYNSFCRFF